MKVTLSEKLAKRLGTELEVAAEELVEKLGGAFKALEDEVASLKADAEIGKQLLTETRERAATLYKAFKGEEAKESFIKGVIEKADLETAKGLVEEYQAGVEEKVPLACPKCGEKLSRRSSTESDGGGAGDGSKRAEDYKIG